MCTYELSLETMQLTVPAQGRAQLPRMGGQKRKHSLTPNGRAYACCVLTCAMSASLRITRRNRRELVYPHCLECVHLQSIQGLHLRFLRGLHLAPFRWAF